MQELNIGKARNAARQRKDGKIIFSEVMKSGCNPRCQCGKCRLCILSQRAEKGQDLWTGIQLTAEERK